MRVLIAEDDRRVAGLLKNRLKSDHISADVCYDGQEALELSGVVHYDVIVLDIMMPKMDGLKAVRRMRERGTDTPVLFLTARDAIEDRVGGLNAGADDYLVKPFAYEELLARIHVLARRQKATGNLFTLEDLTLDASRHVATRGGTELHLTSREYAILEYLIRNDGVGMSPEEQERMWDRFWRADSSRNSEGTGLGLAIARWIIDRHGGTAQVRSAPGKGTEIRVVFLRK